MAEKFKKMLFVMPKCHIARFDFLNFLEKYISQDKFWNHSWFQEMGGHDEKKISCAISVTLAPNGLGWLPYIFQY